MFFFQAEDGIRDLVRARGLGDVYKRQGGYIESIELRHTPDKSPGTGRAWIRTDKTIVADEPVDPVAGYVCLVDTAHGMNVRVDPREWLCLLYTSDAADERSRVDLGGRRLLKKKKQPKSS